MTDESKHVERLRCKNCRWPFFVSEPPEDCPNCKTTGLKEENND